MAKSREITDMCLFHGKFSDTNKLIDNLRSKEEDSMFKNLVQKFRNISREKYSTEIKHLHLQMNVKSFKPFTLCPFLHVEVGLLKTIVFGIVKTGCFDDFKDFKAYDCKNAKVIRKPIQQTKKVQNIQPRETKICTRQSTFRHNIPVEQALQEYRENIVYAKHRLSKIDSKAIYRALHSSTVKTQETLPKIPICRPEETSTHIINLCFDKDNIGTSSNKVNRSTRYNQTKEILRPRTDSKNQGFKKKAGSN